MERVLTGVVWTECLVYKDDILGFGPNFTTTPEKLTRVRDRLLEAGLKLKAKKCLLFVEEISFPGHMVSVGGERVAKVVTWMYKIFHWFLLLLLIVTNMVAPYLSLLQRAPI